MEGNIYHIKISEDKTKYYSVRAGSSEEATEMVLKGEGYEGERTRSSYIEIEKGDSLI